jgi:hypothetical protein
LKCARAVCIDLALVIGTVVALHVFAWPRAAMNLLGWLVLPLLLSVLWPLWYPRNQTLVDKMVSTVVLRR